MSESRPFWPALGLVRITRLLASEDERVWADAASAELYTIEAKDEQLRVAASAARGLLIIAFERQAREWVRERSALCGAIGLGIVTAAVDLLSDSRWPLQVGLLISCALVGLFARNVARVGGLLVGLGLPLLTTLSGFRGPYEFDRGDAWWPVLPAVLLATFFAAARRLTDRRTRSAD